VDQPAATSIGYGAFNGCTSLSSVSLPEARSIGSSAFKNCTGLINVSLPEARSIGHSTFDGCTSLSSLNLPSSPPTRGNNYDGGGTTIFEGIGSAGSYRAISIIVPSGSSMSYGTTDWPRGNTQAYGGYVNVTITEQ
jgi:hypothetical protein